MANPPAAAVTTPIEPSEDEPPVAAPSGEGCGTPPAPSGTAVVGKMQTAGFTDPEMTTLADALERAAPLPPKTLMQALEKCVQGDIPTERLRALADDMLEMLDTIEIDKVLQTPAHALSLAFDVSDDAPQLVRDLAMHRLRKLLGDNVDPKLLDKIVLTDESLRRLALHPERVPQQVRVRHV